MGGCWFADPGVVVEGEGFLGPSGSGTAACAGFTCWWHACDLRFGGFEEWGCRGKL